MPEDDNTLNNELAQAVKLLDGEVVAEPEKKVEAVTPEVVPEVIPEVIPEVVRDETLPEADEPEAEKLPHGESSRLGRKVKRIEDTFAEAMAKIDALTNVISQTSIAKPVEPDDEMPEIITTPEDVQKVIDIRDRKRTQSEQNENSIYHTRFATHRTEDPEMYDEVYQEMLKNHNVKNTGKPDIDADINYLKAKNAVLSRKLVENVKPKPNVLSKTPPAVNVPSVSPVVSKQLNLTAEEQKAAEVFGFNEDDLKRIFG